MSAGWGSGSSTTSSSLTLTAGNTYTLAISDDGITVTASITDDVGPKSCYLTATLSTSNTEVMLGWVGLTGSHTFNAAIAGVYLAPPTVSVPTFSPGAGAYTTTQSVTISTATSGAAIYYTTDGSTPTSSSTLYTGAISVTPPETVKAIGILAGWTDSLVASAAYVIALVQDTFTDTDGTNATAHTPDVGPSPTSTSSNYLIESDQLTNTVDTTNPTPLVYDSGQTDVSVTATLTMANTTSTSGIGGTFSVAILVIRYVDDNNYLFVQLCYGTVNIMGRFAGGYLSLTSASFAASDGTPYVVNIRVSGDAITASIDGVQYVSATNSSFSTSTNHGAAIFQQTTGAVGTTVEDLTIAGA